MDGGSEREAAEGGNIYTLKTNLCCCLVEKNYKQLSSNEIIIITKNKINDSYCKVFINKSQRKYNNSEFCLMNTDCEVWNSYWKYTNLEIFLKNNKYHQIREPIPEIHEETHKTHP